MSAGTDDNAPRERQLRVRVVQRVLPEYRVPIFERLAQEYEDFLVLYGTPYRGDSVANADVKDFSWAVPVRTWYAPGASTPYHCALDGDSLRGAVVVVNAEVGNLTWPWLLWSRRRHEASVVAWSFGYEPSRGFDPAHRWKDRLRAWLYRHSDAVLLYWDRARHVLAGRGGLGEEKLFVAPNTLDTNQQARIRAALEEEGRDGVRQRLGVGVGPVFSYVGRLVDDKEVDRLISAWSLLEGSPGWTGNLLIVGDGPENQRLRDMTTRKSLRRARFLGELRDPARVGEVLFASDAVVIPGRLGLAVVHAFCFGTPVISTLRGELFHGEGIGYLENEANGLLVEAGNNDALAGAMQRIAGNSGLLRRLRQGAERTLRERASFDVMIRGIKAAIRHAADARRRRTDR